MKTETVIEENDVEKPEVKALCDAPCSALQWHDGPGNGGTATYDKDIWRDGETLLVITKKSEEYRMDMVHIDCDVHYFEVIECVTGRTWDHDASDILAWAKVEHNLPEFIPEFI